ncbi:MmcQ/YjbR family DNA-binding protein [Actinomadura madurae]|uniref:MmcQ/YjbR family DNA-binding protein n=1 Tax=Actinomadura madurae TaxID=1993 RepID=UPI0020276A9E|nr:MmcQ/YjbR family DNA-binding protein [Actinomadura madurae]MCP9948122.1 MmcQ/YjbR family DNA-binding protein [Actinomadura madurae]MCP9964895.1 MmcQ/YjbR family DNA-binding protein [Actinomadura madurae]MCP9977382.1 MmcQ/YjbR family DNA-binding protein [Actinomadura madurae]MCQ0011112.1 MmcQ/YjbR family DNA-binding protein [Actinomadura madurae]MCQ0013563.1 MmcQ/YjbR family DNA-binding protein [Actinomadura madurae]
MTEDPVQRPREMCLAVPGVVERLNHGEPSWAVRRKTLVTFSERNPEGRVGFWCPAPPGELEALVAAEPDRFFRPPFGGKGWLGVYLDVPVDWPEVAEIITEAYHLIAPKNLADRHRRLIERGDV